MADLPSAGLASFRRYCGDLTAREGAYVEALAGRLGITRQALHAIIAGISSPRLRVAVAIERETADWAGGPILASSWVPEPAAAEVTGT